MVTIARTWGPRGPTPTISQMIRIASPDKNPVALFMCSFASRMKLRGPVDPREISPQMRLTPPGDSTDSTPSFRFFCLANLRWDHIFLLTLLTSTRQSQFPPWPELVINVPEKYALLQKEFHLPTIFRCNNTVSFREGICAYWPKLWQGDGHFARTKWESFSLNGTMFPWQRASWL